MTAYIVFIKKEFMELLRTGKLTVLAAIFLLFGIMNPAIAKLTPYIMKMAVESLSDSGIVVTGEFTVNDMTSWTQFYKNIPIAIIIFIIMFSGIITTEYQRGTLIPMYTKGISPVMVYFAKYTMLLVTWTAGYGLTFGVTYIYNQYYWRNEATQNIVFSSFAVYLLGVFLLSLMMLMSTLLTSNTSVMVSTACIFFIMYLISVIPNTAKYLPTKLMESNELMVGKSLPVDYTISVAVTLLLSLACVGCSGIIIRKKPV